MQGLDISLSRTGDPVRHSACIDGGGVEQRQQGIPDRRLFPDLHYPQRSPPSAQLSSPQPIEQWFGGPASSLDRPGGNLSTDPRV